MHQNELQSKLKIDCEQCSGLCCVALFCMKSDGFPANKEAGIPCKHLMDDFRCDIHSHLMRKNMRGCLAYDCFGAGQKVTQKYDPHMNWKTAPDKANEIFQIFMIVFQLHQMEWYLLESLSLVSSEQLKSEILALVFENEQMTAQVGHALLNLDVINYRHKVNQVLKVVSESIKNCYESDKTKDYIGKDFKKSNLKGKDFSMSLVIGANFEGCNLHRANFLGADMRDANIKNTDLSECVFLTQMQINSAKGNAHTKVPKNLSHPISWKSS